MKSIRHSEEFELAGFYCSMISSAIRKEHTRVSFSTENKQIESEEKKDECTLKMSLCLE
jgi:hypothetical protein